MKKSQSLRIKAFALIMVFAVILMAISVYVSWRLFEYTTDDEYKTTAVNLTQTEAVLVDGDQLDVYGKRVREIYQKYIAEHDGVLVMDDMDETEREAYLALFEEVYDMPGYKAQEAKLRELSGANDVMYMYITLWDVENGTIIYLMDGSPEGETTPVGYIEQFKENDLEQIQMGDNHILSYVTNYPEYGWLCTATSLIHSSDGEIVAHAYADISMQHVMEHGYKFMINMGVMMLLAILLLMPVILYVFDRFMVLPIKRISKAAAEFVSNRNEETEEKVFDSVEINRKDEIGQLSDSMRKMEIEINDYIRNTMDITAEKERVGAELHIATEIQAAMLPSVFPAFPTRKEFDIFASMHPAKEVGGDFYDFFLIDDDHLAMVIADVSGKGVPAALFMTIAKILIKNRTQSGGSPAEILYDINNMLCEGNKAQLFVTVWLGILTLSTGKGMAANAGHEDPVIRRKGSDFELIKYRHSPALGVMENIRFREHEFELFPGDTLFVYTDGVPEATNTNDELYGTTRMMNELNEHKGERLEMLLKAIREDINEFVGQAPQFDDITMLGFDYYGQEGQKVKELQITATRERLDEVNTFVEETLEDLECSPRIAMQILVALEELYVNIASYAYAPGVGEAIIRVDYDCKQDMVKLELADWGIEFNPLEKEDPDVTLSAEERRLGGLGIYMVKKSMDLFTYERRDGKNIVTIGKKLGRK